MRFIGMVVVLAWVQAASAALAQDPNDRGSRPPAQFDFYQLALTWIPGFCASHPDPQECGRNLGFGLHGLWPQSTDGYPSTCSREPLPAAQRAAQAGLFASPTLIDHEWTKHGTCSGLGATGYFALIRQVLAAVRVPPQYQHQVSLHPGDRDAVVAAFQQANPQFSAGSFVLACRQGQVEEIHVCLTKSGAPRACVPWEAREGNCR